MNVIQTLKASKNLLPIIVIFIFVIGYMVTGYMTLEEDPRNVPMLTCYVILFLLVLEFFREKLLTGKKRAEDDNDLGDKWRSIPVTREVTGILYVCGLVLGVYLAGFFVAIPVYLFTSIAWLGRQTLKLALTTTIIASLAIYLVFELMLEYRLYKGLLFS